MRPAPALLESLRGLRFAPNRAQPSQGPGERRSTVRGAGLEFMDHRPYRAGDDVRNLDMRLMARFGRPFIRQYAADQKLPVTIVLDTSASMRLGSGAKLERAQELAQLLGFLALACNDVLRICRVAGDRLEWSPRFSGPQHADLLFDWIGKPGRAAEMAFGKMVSRALADLPSKGLVIMISDWLDPDAQDGLRMLGETGHEPVVVQIAAPEEIDPSGLGQGGVTLVDAETGAAIKVTLDADLLARYRTAFAGHKAQLRQAALRARGWYFFLPAADSASRLLQGDARRAGFLV